MYRIGTTVKKTAVEYAPISPSITILRNLKRAGGNAGDSIYTKATKRRGGQHVMMTKWYADRLDMLLSPDPRATSRAKPGGLMRSIQFASDQTKAEIFVPVNSPAGKYAFKMHEEKGKTWKHRGPGTQAKGYKADDKFIERAIKDNESKLVKIVDDEVAKAVRGKA